MNIGTPNNIEVLLHYHVCPHPHPRADAPAVHDAIRMLHKAGAIEFIGGQTKVTPLGAAWVQALCNVPVPTVAFIDEQGRVL
jgi:hypothetical protein